MPEVRTAYGLVAVQSDAKSSNARRSANLLSEAIERLAAVAYSSRDCGICRAASLRAISSNLS